MGHIAGVDSRQMALRIGCIGDEIAQDSHARFIEVFADNLDLKAMRFEHSVPAAHGPTDVQPVPAGKAVPRPILNSV